MAKRICPSCGNKRKRLMEYVELWGREELTPYHFGMRCKMCGHFWEVTIAHTKPL
jgi:uncharacterized Zn finger protein